MVQSEADKKIIKKKPIWNNFLAFRRLVYLNESIYDTYEYFLMSNKREGVNKNGVAQLNYHFFINYGKNII